MNNKSNNGKLIEEIITNYVNKNIFEPTTEFKESLQKTLNSTLKFATKVNSVENKNGLSIGNVEFENENGINSIIDFTIVYNVKTIESYE
jgi:hypothetical protein